LYPLLGKCVELFDAEKPHRPLPLLSFPVNYIFLDIWYTTRTYQAIGTAGLTRLTHLCRPYLFTKIYVHYYSRHIPRFSDLSHSDRVSLIDRLWLRFTRNSYCALW